MTHPRYINDSSMKIHISQRREKQSAMFYRAEILDQYQNKDSH